MSSSPSSSRSSSPSTSSEAGEPDAGAQERLAALERLLQSSLGYAEEEAAPVVAQDKRPAKKEKKEKGKGKEVTVIPSTVVQEGEEEEVAVAFRLFSSQKAPQQIVIREKEDWAEVADRRIRAVEDEPKAQVKKRRREIASIAVEGDWILSQASLQPPSFRSDRLTTRLLTKPSSHAPLPSLAYFNASLPPSSLPLPKPTKSTPGKPSPKTPEAKRTPFLPKHPLERLQAVKLSVVPILKGDRKGAAATGPRKEQPMGRKRKRLSKDRRAAEKRVGM